MESKNLMAALGELSAKIEASRGASTGDENPSGIWFQFTNPLIHPIMNEASLSYLRGRAPNEKPALVPSRRTWSPRTLPRQGDRSQGACLACSSSRLNRAGGRFPKL